eukprot:56525-Eustigmatos_ZCMA.PRE.1
MTFAYVCCNICERHARSARRRRYHFGLHPVQQYGQPPSERPAMTRLHYRRQVQKSSGVGMNALWLSHSINTGEGVRHTPNRPSAWHLQAGCV